MRLVSWVMVELAVIGFTLAGAYAADQEPPNPFGQNRSQRTDAVDGTIELSNGKTVKGRIYLTRSHNLRIYDAERERFRDVPLRVVEEVKCMIQKEWLEKEWRFKENANDEKIFTGRTYPARIYVHEIKLKRGDSIKGPLSALVYVESAEEDGKLSRNVRSPRRKPTRYLLHKRDKGKPGQTLKDLVYVKRIVLTRKK